MSVYYPSHCSGRKRHTPPLVMQMIYETNHPAIKREMLSRNQGAKDHDEENWHLWAQHYHLCHPAVVQIRTFTHLPQNPTLHHMRCQKRIKRWWNSFMCCMRHHAFDQSPNTHLLFISCCFSPISQLMRGENVPPWKWNRTNKWDWVCWPHFVIPHEISVLMQA